jgi:SH3-like domain-containing protein
MTAMFRAAVLAAVMLSAPALAQTRLGPETNLPLPRFVSLNVEKANIRRGPGASHRIDWVFLRRGAPLEVTAEHGMWRKVRDADSAEGWIHHAMLRSARTAVVVAEPEALMRDAASLDAAPVARVEPGVVGRLLSCGGQWCRMEAGGRRGWVQKADLWGVKPDETFD